MRRLVARLRERLVLDRGPIARRCVLVVGVGRSGTNWVAERVSAAIGGRLIREPFLLDDRLEIAAVGSAPPDPERIRPDAPFYLRPGVAAARYDCALERVLEGRLRHYRLGTPPAPGCYRYRVVQEIRANLALGYLLHRWPGLHVVWVLRHPLQVVNSQLRMRRLGWRFDWDPQSALADAALRADHLERFAGALGAARTPAERLAARWCAETRVPLDAAGTDTGVLRVSLERLKREPAEWARVAGFLADRGWSERRLRRRADRPSASSRRSLEQIRSPDPLEELSLVERMAVERLVEAFDLTSFVERECGGA